MNWIGFHLATGLVVTLMLWRWGVGWWRGLASGLILVGVVHVLFGIVFRVALPSGFWG
jgi:hypothetical protein